MKNKTLLQDNVRFHHSKIVKQYTAENNIGMNYIPAYSPIFNPIEMSFYNCPIAIAILGHEKLNLITEN